MMLEPPQGGPTMATIVLLLLLVHPLFVVSRTAMLICKHIPAASRQECDNFQAILYLVLQRDEKRWRQKSRREIDCWKEGCREPDPALQYDQEQGESGQVGAPKTMPFLFEEEN